MPPYHSKTYDYPVHQEFIEDDDDDMDTSYNSTSDENTDNESDDDSDGFNAKWFDDIPDSLGMYTTLFIIRINSK